MKDTALLDQTWAADSSPRICIDSLAVLKATDCMAQPIKTLDAGAKICVGLIHTSMLFLYSHRGWN